MEYKMVTIPFDLETAKKINIGERVGQRMVRELLHWRHAQQH